MRTPLVATLLALTLLSPAAALRADEKASATVAHIRLTGSLDEAPTPDDPLMGPLGENFKAKLDRIKKAASDKDISALYIHLDGLSIGFGKLEELSKAIASVKKAGKKTFAYLEGLAVKDYLLALSCD